MSNVSKSMVAKQTQRSEIQSSELLFAQLRSDINILEKKDFAVLKGELERIIQEVERLKGSLREEVGRVHGGVRLDINLEKARIQDEAASLRDMVSKAEERIDQEIEALTNRMILIRDGTRKSLQREFVGTIFWFLVRTRVIDDLNEHFFAEFIAIAFLAFCGYKIINYNRNS